MEHAAVIKDDCLAFLEPVHEPRLRAQQLRGEAGQRAEQRRRGVCR